MFAPMAQSSRKSRIAIGIVDRISFAKPRPSRIRSQSQSVQPTPTPIGQGVRVGRVILIGGAAVSPAVRAIAPAIFGCPVVIPAPSEYVADGAARQAAWVLDETSRPPSWPLAGAQIYAGDFTPDVRARYAEVRDLTRR